MPSQQLGGKVSRTRVGVILGYIETSRPAWATGDFVSKTKTHSHKMNKISKIK